MSNLSSLFGQNMTWLLIIVFFIFNFMIDAVNKYIYFVNREYLNSILVKIGGYIFFLGMFISEKVSIYATVLIFLLFGFELFSIVSEKNLFFLRSEKSTKNEISQKFISIIKNDYKIDWYPKIESSVTLTILTFDLILVCLLAAFMPFVYFFILYFSIAFFLSFIKKYIIRLILYKNISKMKDGYYFKNQKINFNKSKTINSKKQLVIMINKLYNITMREYQRKMVKGSL